MKQGKEYELFVYEKFKNFFKDFVVTFDDKITGKLSGLERQIDVSIKASMNEMDLTYLVQCKDHGRPADITKIGEFASVMQDIGASKGFLICSAGFAKTIHDYAKTLGIELLSVEDVNSERWKIEIEIPVIYIRNGVSCNVSIVIIPNKALVEKNKNEIKVSQADYTDLSLDEGKTIIKIDEYINVKTAGIDIFNTESLDLFDPNLMVRFSEIWVSISEFKTSFEKNKTYYLKYLTPDEYSHIVDHLRKGVTPLNMSVNNLSTTFDESYVQIDKNKIPVTTGFSFEIEDHSTSLSLLIFVEKCI